MWFVYFIAGFAVAICLALALFVWLVDKSNKINTQAPKITDIRLLRARKRFGQISTRESIREVRKIAQQAIKELS